MSKCTCLVFLFHFLFDVWQVCMQSPGLFDQTVTLRSADSTQRVSRPKHLPCIAWLSLHIKMTYHRALTFTRAETTVPSISEQYQEVVFKENQGGTKDKLKVKKNEENINVPLRWGAKCFCSEKSPLWKLVKIDLTGHLGNFLCVSFHFLTIVFSYLSKLLNTHSGRRHWIRHSQVLWEVIKVNKNNVLYKTTTPQVCQKKERTLPISGISEQHGIFFEGKKTTKNPQNTTWYKSWLSPSRGDLNCFLPKQTRVRLDSASRSPVPHRDEWKTGDKVASPPSSTPSSGYEPPIKQKAENGRGQAPPHRPLVPLVSVILKQKQDKTHNS